MQQFERANPRKSGFINIYLTTHRFTLTLPSNPPRQKVAKEAS
jgi:hypothetical protein